MSTKQIKLQPRADNQNKNSKIDLETREMIYDRLSFNFSFITKSDSMDWIILSQKYIKNL